MSLLATRPGLTDREITNLLKGKRAPQQPINIACRQLAGSRRLARRRRADGLIGNYVEGAGGAQPRSAAQQVSGAPPPIQHDDPLSEDALKSAIKRWLEADAWKTRIAWRKERGIDIDAERSGERWVIEVKGRGSRPEMRVNYFIGILGETLQRMDDPRAQYSIALPDLAQFRGLWARLPKLAKSRTEISMLFVDSNGKVTRETE